MGDMGEGARYQLLSNEEKLKRGIYQDAIISLVDSLLYDAVDRRASDIHLQPHEQSVLVRYRIDGVLYDHHMIAADKVPLVVSRLKILANLDIAQRRLPQDGRFKMVLGNNENNELSQTIIDFRVATFPALHGEKVVVRILDRSLQFFTLQTLGMQQTMLDDLLGLVQRPNGLFLVTGPTGCGKTTMLYALINALNSSGKNIVTIEDPIEYELKGITQSQVNTKAGFTFENGLRAILRQDPDIIMVGEIRDKQTAQIAIEAALTGHLVLSTLHTSDAPGAIARLLEMGIEPFLINATLNGVLAQRLARRLCNTCKLAQEVIGQPSSYYPRGCPSCMHIGYIGRIGLFELLVMNDEMRLLVTSKTDAATLQSKARACGMESLIDDGSHKVKAGITSLEEVMLLSNQK